MIKLINVPSLYASLYQVVEFCKIHSNEEIDIIVPDKLSLFMERFFFEKMGIACSFNIKISTLNRYAKKSCMIDRDKQLSKFASILIVHKIMNKNADKLKTLKSKAYSFEYAENIYKTLVQLKASKINFDEMLEFNSTDEQLKNKILDLALIYEHYETEKAGKLDASDQFLMSALSVAEGRENKQIIFCGFDDFTAIEYSIIEQLAKVTNVNILTYFGKGANRNIYNNEIYSQLFHIARVCEINFEVEDAAFEVSNLKKFLHSNLFGLKDEQFVLDKESISIYSAEKVLSEIEFVARNIRQDILRGFSYSNFGVAVYNLEQHKSIIKEIFEKYEINYYIDTELMLNNSVFYKFLCDIFKYNLEGYNLTTIIDLINSPFFNVDVSDKRRLVCKLLQLNFRGKITASINLGEEFDDIKIKFVEYMSLFNFSDLTAIECIEKIKQICKQLSIDEILQNLASESNLQDKLLLKKSENVVFNLFEDILSVNENLSIDDLYDIFAHASSVVKINNLPLTLDAVKVVDANNSMEIFDNLFIVDCTTQNAPNLKFDCGVILDGEIENLNFSHKLAPTIAHINKLAKLRLFNLALMFEKSLTITYSNNASDLVKEFTSKIMIRIKEFETNIVSLKQYDGDKYIALSKWDLIQYNCENNLENNEKIIKNKDFSSISNKNLNIFNNFNIISASQLENYFKCPFFYFLANILKINPRLGNDILLFDIGNVLHEIMFKYYKRKKQVGDIYEFCKNEVFAFVDKDDRLKMNSNSPILINLIDEAVRVINGLNYIDENSNFKPKMFEFAFGEDTALKLNNILINGKIDRVDECGDMLRIIDYKSGKADASLKELYYGNKLQLFLYSCAMEQITNKKIVGGFYLPLHNAYEKELGNTYSLKGFFLNEDFVVSSFDKRLTPGVKSDIVNVKMNNSGKANRTIGYKELDIVEMESLKKYSKHISEMAVYEIKSGNIMPSPNLITKACGYCPYNQICLKNSCGIGFRQAEKVDLSSFKED